LLLGEDGRRLSPNVANHVFHALTITAGVTPRSARCRPRQHDLRHTLAVRTLLDGYRSGEPVGPRIVALSTYLGHYAGDRVKRRVRRTGFSRVRCSCEAAPPVHATRSASWLATGEGDQTSTVGFERCSVLTEELDVAKAGLVKPLG